MPAVRIRMLGRLWPAFQVCGVAGLMLAVSVCAALTVHLGLSAPLLVVMVLVACATFLALVESTRRFGGEERIVFYHHLVAVLSTCAAVLWMAGAPLLPYLDICALGVCAFLACGRMGCFMVGCCHGRPARWGARYGKQHAAEGFDPRLTGIPLLPVQAFESLWVLAVTAIGAVSCWSGAQPGSTLAWCLVAYSVGRFGFEFLRGDVARPVWLGLSEAQWTAWALTGGTAMIGRAPWQIAASGAVTVAATIAMIWRRHPASKLSRPDHVVELAGAIRHLLASAEAARIGDATLRLPARVPVVTTTRGIRISGGEICNGGGRYEHYTVSSAEGNLDSRAALALARLIRKLRPGTTGCDLILAGDRGAHHILIRYASRDVARHAEVRMPLAAAAALAQNQRSSI
jgi:hypothetical protein